MDLAHQLGCTIEKLLAMSPEEIETARYFRELKLKYKASFYSRDSPTYPLYSILLKLDTREILNKHECDFLEAEGLWATLAIYFEQLFERTSDPWNLVKSSRFWRSANSPENALRVTEQAIKIASGSSSHEALPAILTTRGAAYKDIGNLGRAESYAKQALNHEPTNFHPYNLLGAIQYELGNPHQGDEYFKKAIKYGSPREIQQSMIRDAIIRRQKGKNQRG